MSAQSDSNILILLLGYNLDWNAIRNIDMFELYARNSDDLYTFVIKKSLKRIKGINKLNRHSTRNYTFVVLFIL